MARRISDIDLQVLAEAMAQNLNERHAPHYAVGEREGSTLMYIDLENCDLLQWLRDAKERAQL